MGCGIEFLKWLGQSGRIPREGRLLDIGESCLLCATQEEIDEVLARHGCRLLPHDRWRIAEEFAYRSNLFAVDDLPTLLLGDVFSLSTVEYVSLDVVSSRYADVFDINIHNLARSAHNSFDIVINFGTTEHLMNQYNAFKIMHEACKPGGYIFHQIPSTGYINHGYFCYNALMFKELGEANEYELLDLWFYGPNGDGNVLVNSTDYPGVLDDRKLRNNLEGFRKARVPNSLINVLFRKTSDREFRVGLEVKTAAGALDRNARFTSRYIERGVGAAGAA